MARLLTCCVLLLALLAGNTPHAQTPTSPAEAVPAVLPSAEGPVPARYDSPRDTMRTFLVGIKAVEAETGDASWPVVLDGFELEPLGLTPDDYAAQRLAEDLLEVLDRIRFVEYDDLPDTPGLRPGQRSYTYFPRPFKGSDDALAERFGLEDEHISLSLLDDGTWRFNADTLSKLPSLHEKALQKGDLMVSNEGVSSAIEQYLPPDLVQNRWLDVKYWQWIGLLSLILIGVVLDRVVRGFWRVLIVRQIGRRKGQELADSIATAGRPLGMFLAGMFWLGTVPLLTLNTTAYQLLYAAAAVWAVLAGTWAAWRLVDLGAEVLAVRATRTSTKLDDILVPLLRRTLKIFVAAIGIVYGAEALNIPVGPMIASLGLGGLAFAFAAKDTIENFFGSVAVVLDRPFEVGDWVVINDIEGTVEELGFRSTRIRTFYNSQITVPNATLVRAAIDNYGRRKYRRWKTHLGVQYDTTPDQLIAFTEGIRELVRTHPYTRKDYYQVWCHEFADSSLNVLLYIFFEVPDWNTELRERERMFVDIVRLADRLGVSFAFPTTTVHLFKEERPDPALPYEPQHEPPGKTSDRRAMVQGIRAAQQVVAQQSWQDAKPPPQTYGQAGPTALAEDAGFDPADATENTQSVELPPEEPEAPAGDAEKPA